MQLLDIIRKPSPTAKQLGDALAAEDADLQRAEERLDELERERTANLLDLNDAELEKLEAKITAQTRGIERLALAEKQEGDAARRKRYDEARKLAKEGARHLAAYEEQAFALLETLREVYRIEAAIFEANADLPEGAERIDSPERIARFVSEKPTSPYPTSVYALTAGLSLPALRENRTPLWLPFGGNDWSQPGEHAAETVELLDQAIKRKAKS